MQHTFLPPTALLCLRRSSTEGWRVFLVVTETIVGSLFCDVGICTVSSTSFVLLHVVISVLRRLQISPLRKLPTYPFLKPTFCPKCEVSVNVDLGEG